MTSLLLSQKRSASIKNTAQNSLKNSLIVIDAGVAQVSDLVADVASSHADVLLLSANQDGIAQITEALKGRSHLSSLHIVSHGTPGSLRLGNTRLSFETLSQHSESLAAWAQHLNGQDILIYGCQVAKGALGHLFLQQMQWLTGANIAAATARVGRIGRYTNWTLDTELGNVATPVAFSDDLQATYAGHFDPVVDFSLSTDTVIESEGTPFSFIFELSEAPPAGGTKIRFEADQPQAINQWDLFSLSFTGLAGQPVDISPNLDFSAFELTITEQRATIDIPGFNDFTPEGPDPYTWSISPISGGTVGNSSASVTIYDDPSQVPSEPTPIPVVNISSDITTLVEDEGTEVTFTITLSEPPTDGAVLVNIETGKPFSLGDFDIFAPPPQASSTGGRLARGNADNSGFLFAVTEQTATITLPIFDDPDRTEDGTATDPTGPLRNDDIGEEQTTFSVVAGDGYTIGNNSAVTLTLKDTNQPPPPVNVAPEAGDDSYSTAFGEALNINANNGVLSTDTDADGDTLTVAIAEGPSNGTVDLSDNGSFTYTPNAGFSGEDTFTYNVSDGNGGTDSATVTVSVADAVNNAPVADDDSYSTAFGEALTVNAANGVLNGDVDADGDDLSAEIDADPSNGTVALSDNGSFTYTPNAGFSGEDSFTYNVSDGNGGTDSATVTVSVADAVNNAPVADDDSYSTAFGEALTVNAANGVLNGDVDADGDDLSAEIDADPSNGTVALSDNGSFTYTPNAGFSGEDSFTYNVSDGNGGTDSATVTVSVAGPTNSAPVADDDSYSTAFGEALTVNAANGVLNGDVDADGDDLSAEIDADPSNGTVALSDNGSFTYTPNAGFSGEDSFTYNVSDGNGGTDSATVSVTVNPEVVLTPPQVSLTTSTNFGGPENALVEDEGTALTVQFTLDAPAPTGGLRVFIDSEVEQIINRLDLPTFAFNPQVENINPASIGTDFNNTGLVLTIAEGATSASLTIPVFDNAEPDTFLPETFDGKVDAVFSLKTADQVSAEDAGDVQGVGDYTVDASAASSAVTFVDTAAQLNPVVGDPIVSFSTTPGLISEADGTSLVMNFSVDGDIPEGGITVNLEGDAARIMQQFTAAQTRFDSETGEIFYRFDKGLLSGDRGSVVGGTLELFSLEDGDASEAAADPAAAGDAFLSNFSFTITEANASITIPVFDDIVEEADQTFTYTLAEGTGYTVDSAASSGTFTVTDGVTPATSPTIGVTADVTSLVEDEQTPITITFTSDGDIPAEGVVVQLRGPVRSIAEFDINSQNTNPREPDEISGIDGVQFTGGSIVGSDNVAGSVFFRITDPTATISVPVFDDDVAEGTENLTFELVDGEAYEVDAAASSFDVSIEDGNGGGGGNDPIVSFSTTPGLISEADGTSLVMNFSVDGDIPEGGITVNLEGDAARIMQQFTAAQTRFDSETGEIFYRFDKGLLSGDRGSVVGGTLELFSLEDGDASEVAADPAAAGDAFLSNFSFTITEANASITIPVFDDIVEEADQTFTYTLAEGTGYTVDSAASSGTFTVTDGVTPATSPTIGVTADVTSLVEDEQTPITITFTSDGDIPAEGVIVQLRGPVRSIAEFDINSQNTNPREPDEISGIDGVQFTGGSIVGSDNVAGSVFFRITDPTATISVPVFDDDVAEGTENLTFELVDGEAYEVDAAASSFDVSIEDGNGGGGGNDPVVSFSTTSGVISEADGTELVLNFSVDGDIPEGGITVNLEGDTAEILQQFLAPDGDGAVQTRVTDAGTILYRFDTSFAPGAGLAGGTLNVFSLEDGDPAEDNSDPAAAGTGFLSNFSFTITEPTASITLPVSDDLAQELDQTFTYTLAEGEGYVVDPDANSGTFTVTDGVTPVTSPVVGVTTTPETLIESEQTVFTVTFTTEGDIPAEGLVVQLQGPPRAIAEFDINATNPRLPESETVVEGVVVEGGSIVGTDEVAGSLFFRITDPTATISVPVFDDGPGEGTESLSFTLVDGEAYDVDAAASAVDVTIEDGSSTDITGTEGSDRIFGTEGNDTINALAGSDAVKAGAGDDTIDGGSGQDRLFGEAGNDSIDGGTESDRIFGGSGNDIVDGGSGQDRIFGEDGNDMLTGGSGKDAIFGGAGADTIDGGSGQDRLFGDEGNDVITGGSGQDRLFGGAGQDIVLGGLGSDRIFGGAERDVLLGDGGNDFISGGDGDDVLMGVTGDDVLEGGAGADLFVFGTGDGSDVIKDFEAGVDRIGLITGELTFEDLAITQRGNSTLLGVTDSGKTLAVLRNVQADSLTASSFTAVDEVSTVEQALTLL